jgi:hypothetical protein
MSDVNEETLERLAQKVGEQFESRFSAYEETMDEKNRIVQENIDKLFDKHLDPIREDISAIHSDIATIKPAIKATNEDLHALESRVTRLEARV